jgi:hypothetical protein
MTPEDAFAKGAFADVLHLGDVLEHLTDIDRELPGSSRSRTEVSFAQGPRSEREPLHPDGAAEPVPEPSPEGEMPLHVLLATVDGQWALFRPSV